MSFVRLLYLSFAVIVLTPLVPSLNANARGDGSGAATVSSQPRPSLPRFRVLVLPTLPGGATCFAEDINDSGQIAGGSTTPGTSYPNAVAWIDGQVINITGEGVSGASATAVSSDGTVVGGSDSLGLSAFRWKNGVLTPLMNPIACCSGATALNDAGLIIGHASLNGPNTPNDGVMWDNGTVIPLGTLGGTLCHPYDINALQQIVGTSDQKNNGEYLAFIWQNGTMVPLPGLGGTFDGAHAISDQGIAVGFAAPGPFGRRAVKWVNGKVIPLSSLGGGLSSAQDINESGWIVGDAWTSPQAGTTAALWIGEQGLDLTRRSLLQPGDRLYDARGVNESGQIVGEGFFVDGSPGLPGGTFLGYMLTPLRLGDVDGDDAVNVDDLLAVINGWGACPLPLSVATCPADVNSDGVVNVDDLLRVINDWG